MRIKNVVGLSRQTGAVSLFVALMLIISMTLVLVMTARTVVTETKVTADNHRMSQAVAAANYAMDFGVSYFDSGGFDQNEDGNADNIHLFDGSGDGNLDELRLTSTDGSQMTTATVSFEHDAAECGGGTSWLNGLITAVGYSDDGEAKRTILQCVGTIGLVRDEGPKQPLVAQGQVLLTGTANLTNRYTDTTIWSGGDVKIGSSSSMETYIRDPAIGDLDPGDASDFARLVSLDETSDTLMVSNKNLGNGLDVIDDDPSLGELDGIDFFINFFDVASRTEFKSKAANIGQVYTDIDDAIGKSGPIWIVGDAHLTGGTIGSLTSPAILVVNGDMTSTGNSTLYGMLYVIGTYTVGGTINVIGANVVEGTSAPVNMSPENNGTESASAPPVVSGNGTLNLVFWPAFGGEDGNPVKGLTATVAGSWRDWE